jgi:hypothetical protein
MGAHIRPEAWRLDDNERNGFLAPLTQAGYPNIRFWEYNSVDENGNPIDVSLRHPISRQLTAEEAAFWRNPANVLGGWVPSLGTVNISLLGLNQTYTGQPLGVTVVTDPPNLATRVTYNGSETAPVNAGSYTVVATITEPGYSGTVTGTLVIVKATATVTLGNLTQAADGTARTVTVTTDPPGLPVTITYNGSPTAPTAPGTYQVVATVNDPNYQGSATGTLTITDTTAPTIRSLTASPNTLSPPNGRMQNVTITADVVDNADATPTTRIISVTGNQDIAGDFTITGPLTLQLRAERTGGRARVYTITVESRDDANNVSTATVTVTVP